MELEREPVSGLRLELGLELASEPHRLYLASGEL